MNINKEDYKLLDNLIQVINDEQYSEMDRDFKNYFVDLFDYFCHHAKSRHYKRPFVRALFNIYSLGYYLGVDDSQDDINQMKKETFNLTLDYLKELERIPKCVDIETSFKDFKEWNNKRIDSSYESIPERNKSKV